MTDASASPRGGRKRSSFHSLRIARRSTRRRENGLGNRKSHQTEVRERRTRILLALTMALGFELAGAALTSPLLGINHVAVRGDESLPAQEAATTRRMAEVPAGTNLLRAPLGSIERRMKLLPWVRTARVGWMSPHGLIIHFAPRQSVVVAEIAGRRYEIDETGVPIRIARAAEESRLPRITVDKSLDVRAGVPLRDESLLAAIKIYLDGTSQTMVHIAKIDIDPAGNMCLNMMDGIQVHLGQPDDLTEKLKYVQRVYTLDPNVSSRMVAINLSVPKQPACTLKKDIQVGPVNPSSAAPVSDAPQPDGGIAL